MQFKRLQQFAFLFLVGVISIAFVWVIFDYLLPLFWAVVFAIIFRPLYLYVCRNIKNRGAASLLTLILILVIFFVPLSIIGGLVYQEAVHLVQQFNTSGNISFHFIDQLGHMFSFLDKFGISQSEIQQRIIEYTSGASQWIGGQALAFGRWTLVTALEFFVMLYVLFFFLRDGDRIEKRLIEILPFGDRRERKLFTKFAEMTRAVVKGTLLVALIQGILGGFLFWIAGIESAVLWGVLMTILAVIPALGTFIVWLPAGIILLATGHIVPGIVVLAGGALVVSTVDNILRPILVGKETRTHDVFILLSTLGGISLFGITGLVIGPIVAGFFIAAWEMFEEEFRKTPLLAE